MPRDIDEADRARFARIGAAWWDGNGPMRALHHFNPVRVGYVRDLLHRRLTPPGDGMRPLFGLDVLDIGCGGGLLAEPLTRLGATVTGIDPATESLTVARAHAQAESLTIDYRSDSAEALAQSGAQFDAVLAMEVIEHVRDMRRFVRSAARLLRPNGLLVTATLNRTLKSFALAVLGAEYVLGWVPKGTHDWGKFVRPAELEAALREAGLTVCDRIGVLYDPFFDAWRLSPNMDINYMLAAEFLA
jgi:2-polyprenyl-6-hydroxyphenyl methylase/3-demethylubiquinone-9 3-methyltransferase